MAKSFDFSDFEMTGASGFDDLFTREAHIVSPHKTGRRKVAALGDISDLVRVSSDTLVHRSSRELWALKKESDGNFYVERLFDDNGSPLKG